MSGGLLGASQFYRQDANKLWGEAADTEAQRDVTNKGLKAAEKTMRIGAVGTGAGVGAAVGAGLGGAAAGTAAGAETGSMAGPWGAVIGAGVGLIASYLF